MVLRAVGVPMLDILRDGSSEDSQERRRQMESGKKNNTMQIQSCAGMPTISNMALLDFERCTSVGSYSRPYTNMEGIVPLFPYIWTGEEILCGGWKALMLSMFYFVAKKHCYRGVATTDAERISLYFHPFLTRLRADSCSIINT